MTDYIGPERRKDYLELDTALAEVQKLHGSVTTLANAMTNAVPRHELEELRTEVRRDFIYKVYIQLGLTVFFVIFFIVFVNIKFNNLDKSVQKGHEVILCMQGKTEAARTGDAYQTARLVCEQTTKG